MGGRQQKQVGLQSWRGSLQGERESEEQGRSEKRKERRKREQNGKGERDGERDAERKRGREGDGLGERKRVVKTGGFVSDSRVSGDRRSHTCTHSPALTRA